MLVSLLGLHLLGSVFFLTRGNGLEDVYDYYKLGEWGFTVSGLKVFGIIILFVGWGAWILLGVLIERKLKILIFRRPFLLSLLPRVRPNLLKVIVRKGASPPDGTENKKNS